MLQDNVSPDCFVSSQASDYEACMIRQARIATNTDTSRWKRKDGSQASVSLNKECRLEADPMPRLRPRQDATGRIEVIDSKGMRRGIAIEEAERAMGYGNGITNGFGAVELTDAARFRLLAGAVCVKCITRSCSRR
jgi:hypothetical protein